MMMGAPADDAPGLAFYSALLASPFVDRLTLDFARAAIAGEAARDATMRRTSWR